MVQRLILAAVLMAGLVPAFAQSPTPVPALPDVERRTSYTITNSTCACSLGSNLQLYGDGTDYQNWVEVWLNGTQLQYNDPVFGWAITSPSGPIGNLARPITNAVLTFNNPQTGTVQIVGARRPRRVSQFSENAGVSARNLNQVFTDIVAMLREAWDKINDVTGRVIMAPPGETMTPLPPAADRANLLLCFDSVGNPAPCANTSSGTIIAGNGISVTGENPTTIASDIQGSGAIVVSGTKPLTISCPTCTAAVGGSGLIPSRAAATALNLSTYNVIVTGGYSQPGDGGGATFKNVGSAAFLDSFVPTGTGGGTITNQGTACTNGTYLGVSPTGGNGSGLQGIAVVSSGILASFTVTGTGGNGYDVNDVLTLPSGSVPCTTQPTWKVTSVSTPTGSFTDSVGTHFQIIADQGNYNNIKQFGAACNWTKAAGDSGSTDDTTDVQNALNFAGALRLPTVDAGGTAGETIILPACASLVSSLQVPFGVTLRGQGRYSSLLKEADALSASSPFITLCDPTTHLACFGTRLEKLQLFPGSGSANSNVFMVYSNNIQQMDALSEVDIFPGPRGCIQWDTGFGGAAFVGISQVECTLNGASANPGIGLSYGAAVQTIRDSVVESVGFTGNAIIMANTGGVVVIDGLHTEGITNPIFFNVTSGGITVHIENVTGGSGCNNLITRQSGSFADVIKAGSLQPILCSATINNAGSITTGVVTADVVF